MATYEVEITDNAVPLELVVEVPGTGGIPGLVPTLSVRNAKTLDSYLDFADNVFKTSGWTTKSVNVPEVGGGRYAYVLNLAGLGLAQGGKLAAEYTVTEAIAPGVDTDLLLLVTKLAQIDKTRKYATNRLDVAGGNPGSMVLYDDDATTPLASHTLRDPTGGAVSNVAGSAAKRGAAT